MRHGTANAYSHGCRCESCTKALRDRMRTMRAKGDAPNHGTTSGYRNHGCRCDPCKAAGSRANALVVEKIKAGEWNPSHGTRARHELTGCRCEVCTEAQHERSQTNWREKGATEWLAANAASIASASKHGQEWTGPELEFVARDDLSIAQLAAVLGRSLASVRTMRYKVRHDPMKRQVAGVGDDPRDGG